MEYGAICAPFSLEISHRRIQRTDMDAGRHDPNSDVEILHRARRVLTDSGLSELPIFQQTLAGLTRDQAQPLTLRGYAASVFQNATTHGLFRGINTTMRNIDASPPTHYSGNIVACLTTDLPQRPNGGRVTSSSLLLSFVCNSLFLL